MYSIYKSKQFIKKARKFFKQHPDLISNFKSLVIKLEKNPFDKSIKLHYLKGKLQGLASISLNYKYRVILNIRIVKNKVLLIDIGSHDVVY